MSYTQLDLSTRILDYNHFEEAGDRPLTPASFMVTPTSTRGGAAHHSNVPRINRIGQLITATCQESTGSAIRQQRQPPPGRKDDRQNTQPQTHDAEGPRTRRRRAWRAIGLCKLQYR